MPKTLDEDDDFVTQSFHDLDGPSDPKCQHAESSNPKTGSREPRSALEHYEKAVERESQGNLGDSLDLYRKAFRVGPSKPL
jgi:F-box protein 9